MSLFHAKIIKKITAPVLAIPPAHAEILASWAQSIENNTIHKQKETALDGLFKEKIVTGILGYQPFGAGASYDVFAQFPIAGGSVDMALGVFVPQDETQSRCIAPFEVKGAKTNLDSIMPGRNKTPVQQAWEYTMDAKGAQWVLVSNYLKIRLYAVGHGRQDYEEFDLAKLADPAEYTRFYRLLCKDSLLGGQTKTWLDESAQQDKQITALLYQDYKDLRLRLIRDIQKSNPAVERADAISYAQTLLDRALFVAFAEDKALLPSDSLKKAVDHKDLYHPRPVWDTFKALFAFIDRGNPPLIPKYNGGLFAEDKGLDALVLPDAVFAGFKQLGTYDFNSEISVTILGHIFEQSISDLEALHEGKFPDAVVPKKDGKRKKEGVVYTPDFVTRFIVEKTLGGFLEQKKRELRDENSAWFLQKGERKGEYRDEKAEIEYWHAWQDTLKTVKVVDPACGSGAFLVAAFDCLHEEYSAANGRIAELHGGNAGLFDPDREILTHNLFGVDINSESIEITKLSLWLKTAKRGKELNSLDKNFRWGDSLIEDSNFSARAFTWKDAFPDIFKNGGFDVVLGNPPYVRQELISPLKPYLEKRFEVYDGAIDLYAYFFELGLRVLKPGGRMGYISSATFFKTGSGQNLRAYLKQNAALETIVDFGDLQVFEGVTTYPAILVMRKGAGSDLAGDKMYSAVHPRVGGGLASAASAAQNTLKKTKTTRDSCNIIPPPTVKCQTPACAGVDYGVHNDDKDGILRKPHELSFIKLKSLPENLGQKVQAEAKPLTQSVLNDDGWQLESVDLQKLREKIVKGRKTLKEVYGSPLYGIKTGYNEAFVIDKATRERLIKEDSKSAELIKPFLEGKDLQKWHIQPRNIYLIFTRQGVDIEKYPAIKAYLEKFRQSLEPKPKDWPTNKEWMGRKAGHYKWYEIQDTVAYHADFEKPKIIYAHFQSEPLYSYETKQLFLNNKCYIFPDTGYYELALLNSSVMWFIFKAMTTMVRGGYYEATTQNIQDFPIPTATSTQKKKIGDIAEACQKAAEERYAVQEKVRVRVSDLASSTWDGKLGKKLGDWWALDFKAFQAEVKKLFKRDIPIFERDDWQKYLSIHGAQVSGLTQKIAALEEELNKEIYALFNLTPEDIRLVEETVNG